MNTLFFKYALEVERTQSITKAAENMFMAQPNLSRAIKELEETLGFVIFERTSQGVVATEKGKTFLKYAKNIVTELSKMESINETIKDDVQRFSISIPRGSYIADSVTNFASELDNSKKMEIYIKETNALDTIDNIEGGKFKLGIIRFQSDNEPYFKDFLKDKRIVSDVIWDYECLVVMSKDNPLANIDSISNDDLKDYIEITHADISIPYVSPKKEEDIQSGSMKKIYLYDRCNQFEMLSRITSTFMWVSPIPDHILNKYGLIQRKCNMNNNRYKDVLIYSEHYKLTPLDRRFIEKLYESKTEVCYKDYR